MPLSPLDIHNKEFTRGFRGYAEDEVNEFLDQIIKDYEIILREKKELEEKVKSMSEQMSRYNTLEETLQKSIVVAQEAAEEVRRNSQQESKLIIKEAEKNADRIVNDALGKARKIAIEIDELKKQSKVFRNRFKMLVEAQLDLLNTDDWDHLMEYDVSLTNIQNHHRNEDEDGFEVSKDELSNLL
ncbi:MULTISPECIES: DivIVA domain-containing protein [Lysinibacillus]|uniref:DivIVA domain-containing protein n=1 Tax=Lysinibacillus antri TaxID=2498145 RepID=A0A3S0R868_9BACI|nr:MULTISPECIES: DivIVA domain-containing protein [Lysinibacillus]RUL55890.1 DivIVA domain-containing protein [Lysinibacillus antri]TSI11493.1 DivIVA domain-containing protein [Lysinibacillus sp. BW-2-10]